MFFCKAYVNCVFDYFDLHSETPVSLSNILHLLQSMVVVSTFNVVGYPKCFLWKKNGPPIVVWQAARTSSSPRLCADTPEFSWPATEPMHLQGGRATMCGHWSIALTAQTLDNHPILSQSGLWHWTCTTYTMVQKTFHTVTFWGRKACQP